MQEIKKISFVGGGRVTYLLLHGLQRNGIVPDQVLIYDPNAQKPAKLQAIDARKIRGIEALSVETDADIIFLAVHPPVIGSVAQELEGNIDPASVVVSFVPSVSVARLSELLGGFDRIVRMIPNAPSLIGKGYNPAYFSEAILPDEKNVMKGFFSQWGTTPEVKEKELEAYAIITGMGPTYFWPQWLELKRLARGFGLEEQAATTALTATLMGALDTLFYSCLTPEEVLDLIPAYPLKKDEETIRRIFSDRLSALFEKISLPSG